MTTTPMNPAESLKVTARGDLDIEITRVLDAPRELVFQALTRPELVRRWMNGPPGWETTECSADLRVAGAFVHAWRGPDGVEMSMSGTFQEIVPPERIVRTERFDTGCTPQAGEQLATLVLTEVAGRTTMRVHLRFPSKEARDGMLASGMEAGMKAGYGALDELLADLATR